MDGVGKTSLALLTAHRLRRSGRWHAICRLDARQGWDNVAQQLIHFAAARQQLHPPENFDLDARLRWCLDQWPQAPSPVLLLLDDATDGALLQRLASGMPERFRTLITTRLHLEGRIHELELQPLRPEESLRLLERRSGRPPFTTGDRSHALVIAAEVGHLPLALTLLSRQLRKDPDLTPAVLQQRLVEKGALAEVLQEKAPEQLIDQGLQAGFQWIWESLAPLEQELALCLGELPQAPVPAVLLGGCPPAGVPEEPWEDARSGLIAQSLLERTGAGVVRLHPVLHDLVAALARADAGGRPARQRRVAAAVSAWARDMPEVMDADQRAWWLMAQPHLEAIASWPCELLAPAEVFRPPLALGRFHGSQGLYRAARPWLELAHQRVLTRGDEGVAAEATVLEALGEVQRELGDAETAEESFRRALALRRQSDQLSLEVSGALNGLGLVLHDRGEPEAEPLLRQALALREHWLPSDDDRVIISRNNLGLVLAAQDRTGEAAAQYHRALADTGDRISILSLTLHNNLAGVLRREGATAEALHQLQHAASLTEQVLGPVHPDRGVLLLNLAVLEDEGARHRSAEAHYRQALTILEANWGADDPRSREAGLALETFMNERKKHRRNRM
ncbi:MAG: tetratricopeptide repeat protein [Cyanobacteriota bacterium]